MRKRIILAVLLSVATLTFAASKNSSKQPPSSTGILMGSSFIFGIYGDGISTTFTFTPSRIPPIYSEGQPNLPNLPLVGVVIHPSGAAGNCSDNVNSENFTATVSGNQVVVNFTIPPPADFQTCSMTLLFHPA